MGLKGKSTEVGLSKYSVELECEFSHWKIYIIYI
jgi:hypothetical protein